MSYERWCTKADILNDLAQVTGRIGDVDEEFIVTGEKPPPARFVDEDDEMNLRFRNHQFEMDYSIPPPDLEGISEMLRMVDQYDDDEEFTPVEKSEQIVISKLNPEVPEFIPKGATTSPRHKPNAVRDNKSINNNNISTKNDCRADKTKLDNLEKASKKKSDEKERVMLNLKKNLISDKSDLDMNERQTYDNDKKVNGTNTNDADVTKYEKDVDETTSVEETSNNVEEKKTNNVCCIVRMDKRIDVSELNADQIKEMTMKLKSKISNATRNDDLRKGREKNVAIATLLKLYSATPPQVKSPKPDDGDKNNEKIKLFTPEYFESCRPTNLGTDDSIGYCNGFCNSASPTDVENLQDSSKLSKNDIEITELTKDELEASTSALKTSKMTKKSVETLNKDSMETSKMPNDSTESFKSLKPKATVSTNSNQLVIEKPLTPKLEVEVSKNNKYAADPEIQNSIKKVNHWFDKPDSPKPKPMAICIGPIAFKRKAPIVKSPVSNGTSNRSTPTGITQIAQYKPSKYAEDLSKQFEKQGTQKEVRTKQNQDIWTRAQTLMKEKEEKMKMKLLEQARSSQEELEETGSEYSYFI